MTCNCIRIMTVAFGLLAFGLGAAFAGAGEGAPEAPAAASQGGEAASPSKAPLRVNTIDFQDTGDGSGKLILGGIAIPGSELFLFFDEAPIGRVMPDDGGKWNYEAALTLGDGRHALRADQYDQATNMLAARAMLTIGRPKAAGGETAPGAPAPTDKSPD